MKPVRVVLNLSDGCGQPIKPVEVVFQHIQSIYDTHALMILVCD
jgi:hypothetical protein